MRLMAIVPIALIFLAAIAKSVALAENLCAQDGD